MVQCQLGNHILLVLLNSAAAVILMSMETYKYIIPKSVYISFSQFLECLFLCISSRLSVLLSLFYFLLSPFYFLPLKDTLFAFSRAFLSIQLFLFLECKFHF